MKAATLSDKAGIFALGLAAVLILRPAFLMGYSGHTRHARELQYGQSVDISSIYTIGTFNMGGSTTDRSPDSAG